MVSNSNSDDNIDYGQLLIYFDVCPAGYWLRQWKRIGKNHPQSFKVSYNFGKGISKGFECYFIESNLFVKLLQGEI